MSTDPLAAAILVGGQSRRMGTNKALLQLEPGGLTVVETVVRALRGVTDDVVLVGARFEDYAFLELSAVPDQFPETGPLAGVHAALEHTSRNHVFIVACDMPFLSVDLLRFMASQPRSFDVLIPEAGRLQPLHAIYSRRCLPFIERYLNTGHRQVSGWLDDVDVQVVPEAIVKHHDPTLRSCFNLNTPDDLNRAAKMSQ